MKVRLPGGAAFQQHREGFFWCKDNHISVVGPIIHSANITQSDTYISFVVMVSWVNPLSWEGILL